MTLLFAQLLTTLCSCSPAALQDDRKELALIQGTWLVQRIEENGGRWEKEKEQWTITLTGSQFKLEDQNKATLEGSLTVDTSEKLKRFHASVTVSPTQSVAVVGIYKLEKDTLIFCFTRSKNRPTEFKAEPSDGAILVTARRKAEPTVPH